MHAWGESPDPGTACKCIGTHAHTREIFIGTLAHARERSRGSRARGPLETRGDRLKHAGPRIEIRWGARARAW
jgi:hypothetical protein